MPQWRKGRIFKCHGWRLAHSPAAAYRMLTSESPVTCVCGLTSCFTAVLYDKRLGNIHLDGLRASSKLLGVTAAEGPASTACSPCPCLRGCWGLMHWKPPFVSDPLLIAPGRQKRICFTLFSQWEAVYFRNLLWDFQILSSVSEFHK